MLKCQLRGVWTKRRGYNRSERDSPYLPSQHCLQRRPDSPIDGANDTRPVNAGEHTLFAKSLNRVRRALARIVCARFDHITHLLEHVDKHVFLEGRERPLVGAQI